MLKRKNIIVVLAAYVTVFVSVFMGSTQCAYAKNNEPMKVMQSLQSKEIKKITLMKNGKKTTLTNSYRIKIVQNTLDRSKLIRRKNKDSLKGWTYIVRAKKSNGKTLKIEVINDKLIRIRGKVYKVRKLDLRKLNYCYKNGNLTPILQSNQINSLTVQFQDQTVEIVNPEKVEKTRKIFKNNKFQRIKNNGEKGWIYRIKGKDKDGKIVQEILLVNETRVLCGSHLYKGKKVDINSLDELFGIKRL